MGTIVVVVVGELPQDGYQVALVDHDAGASVDGIRMLKELSEREIRRAAEGASEGVLSEIALRILYQRKAFRESTGTDEEHYPHGDPKPPGHGPVRRHSPGPKKKKGPKPPRG